MFKFKKIIFCICTGQKAGDIATFDDCETDFWIVSYPQTMNLFFVSKYHYLVNNSIEDVREEIQGLMNDKWYELSPILPESCEVMAVTSLLRNGCLIYKRY